MPEMSRQPPQELLAGRRALEGVSRFELLDDLSRHGNGWVIHCRLHNDVAHGGDVPQTTDWYIQLPNSYPLGEVLFYPSKHGGLTRTFPHQSHNGEGDKGVPWRTGRLCLTTQLASLRQIGFDEEPFEPDTRLRWNVERALEWLKLAGRGELQRPGDPFELPEYPFLPGKKLILAEDLQSLQRWTNRPERLGFARLQFLKREPTEILLASCFEDVKGSKLFEPRFNNWAAGNSSESPLAAWIRVDEPPALNPWQAPMTWKELRAWFRTQDVELDPMLRQLFPKLRDSYNHCLLLGFPIPERIGNNSARRMHWLALRLPLLAANHQIPPGFRSNERGLWEADKRRMQGDQPLSWLRSECWNTEELSGRGRLDDALRKRSILLVGAGALGSVVAEILVRGGVESLTIVDDDPLQAGNLVRHTLTLDDLEQNKAEAVASRLSRLSPFAEVVGIGSPFPAIPEGWQQRCREADLVIDCTASEEMGFHLSDLAWPGERTFASLSLGLLAKRLYCFIAQGTAFPVQSYWNAIRPWIRQDLKRHRDLEFPRQGVGCWHPVFPARVDDIWMLASAAVKFLNQALRDGNGSGLTVFEQELQQGSFCGIRRVTAKESDRGA